MNYQGNNPEGYPDPTANQAVGIVSREEKEAAKAKKRATREYDIRAAMKAIRAIAGAYGLTIENRITFKERSQYHPDILPGCREIPAGIVHAHGRPDGHKLSGDQHRKQETGRHLPRNGTGSAGSGRIRRGRAYLTGGQP